MAEESIQERMTSSQATSGFDYLRIGLAVSVVAWHSIMSSYGRIYAAHVWASPWGILVAPILPMFFALSGFLVSASLQRSRTIEGFLALRAVRIVPALVVEVLLCAMLLGPLLTTLPLTEYFTGKEFAAYFLNIVGDIHFTLPGVFEHLPKARVVNQPLWSIPFELECYASLALLAIAGLVRRRALFVLFAVGATVIWPVWLVTLGAHNPHLALPGKLLVLSFLAGVSLYLYRDKIPLSKSLAAVCVFCAVILLPDPLTQSFAVWPLAYLTVWLGLMNPPKIMGADYSYGVYLFAFPIQQTVMLLLPGWRYWWVNLGLALPLAFLYAAFSWHCVEKPALSRKSRVVAIVESVRGAISRRRPLAAAID